MTSIRSLLVSAFSAISSLTTAAAQPATAPAPELGKACEAAVRDKASVVAIISREVVSLDGPVQRYRITFQGAGDVMTATCLRLVQGGATIVTIDVPQQPDRPKLGTQMPESSRTGRIGGTMRTTWGDSAVLGNNSHGMPRMG